MWLFSGRGGDGKSVHIASDGGGSAKPVAAYEKKTTKGDSPSAVVLRSYEALKTGDMAAYRACFTSESMQKMSSAVKAGIDKYEGKGFPDIPNIKIVSVLEEGDIAQVKVAISSANSDESTPIMLRRNAAGWQIEVGANHDDKYSQLPYLRDMMRGLTGLELLEPGKIISDFPNLKLLFAKRHGNWLYDVLAFDNSKPGLSRELRAEKALVSTNGSDIILDMYNVRVSPIDIDNPGTATASRFRHVIPNVLN
jgi:hypothetical protein